MTNMTSTKSKATVTRRADPLATFWSRDGALTSGQVAEVLASVVDRSSGTPVLLSASAAQRSVEVSADYEAARVALDALGQARTDAAVGAADARVLEARAVYLLATPAVRGVASITSKGAAEALGVTPGRVSQILAPLKAYATAGGSVRTLTAGAYASLADTYKTAGAAALTATVNAAQTVAATRATGDKVPSIGSADVVAATKVVREQASARTDEPVASKPLSADTATATVARWLDAVVAGGATGDVKALVGTMARLARALESAPKS